MEVVTIESKHGAGHRIVRELKEGAYHPRGSILHVLLDETAETIHSISL
jgi:hypothetical protein